MAHERKSPLEQAIGALDRILDAASAGADPVEKLERVCAIATAALVELRPKLERKLVNRIRSARASSEPEDPKGAA